MNSFYTPSLGDETFDLSGIDDVGTTTEANQIQQEYLGSKRLQNMDQNYAFNNFGAITQQPTTNTVQQQPATTPTTLAARKQLSADVIDPNEPAKPLSAYAYFFRDTVSAIKQQNPECSFEQLTSIVASMWEVLDTLQKDVYFKKSEAARIEYIKQMRLYQQQKQQEHHNNNTDIKSEIIETEAFTNNAHQPLNPIMKTEPATSPIATATTNHMQADAAVAGQYVEQTINTNQLQAPEVKTESNEVIVIPTEIDLCIREGCNRNAVMNPDWEDEYCSNECVVIHCRNVFNAWVQQNKEGAAAV